MAEVSVRELRNHGGDVLDRVAAGERVVVTRSGKAVAELRPIAHGALTSTLLERWRHLPSVDPQALRSDLDRVVDPGL